MKKKYEIPYYIPSHGEQRKDAEIWHSIWEGTDESEREWIAQEICSEMWDNRDGWEWMQGCDEKVCIVINGLVYEFTFEVEFEPSYSVSFN